jgi:ParB/RepB/Spo0J family partition protein
MTTTTVKKSRSRKAAEPVSRKTGEDSTEIIRVELTDCVTLAANPLPDPHEVDKIAQAFRWRGQDEPIIVLEAENVPAAIDVRALPGQPWSWLVLAGATRLEAARQCGWSSIDARVRRHAMQSVEILTFAYRNNADRRTIGAAEKACYAAALAAKLSDASDEQIAAEMGIDRAEVNQLLRFTSLPEQWQARVARYDRDPQDPDGISWTAAKALLPYVHVPRIVEALEECWADLEDWEGGYTRAALRSTRHVRETVQELVLRHTRPADKKEGHDYGWQQGGYQPRKYEITDEIEAELDIQEFPLGDNGKKVARICNVELNDQLMQPYLEKEIARRNGKGTDEKKTKAKSGEKPSAAELRAKARQQDKQLADRIRRPGGLWELGLRMAIARRIQPHTSDVEWLHDDLSANARDSDQSASLAYRRWRLAAQTWWHRGITGKLLRDVRDEWCNPGFFDASRDCYAAANPTRAGALQEAIAAIRYWTTTFLLYPVSPADDWTYDLLANHHHVPERMVWIPQSLLRTWAEQLEVTIEDTWKAAAVGSDEGSLWLDQFLRCHNRRQIAALAEELGISLDGCKTLTEEIDHVAVVHAPDKKLPLPKVLDFPNPEKKGRK